MVQCAGAIDGSHIPIRPPALNQCNRKGWYSVAVVDHDYLFRDVVVGWPGSVHNARILAHSKLYHKATNQEVLNTKSRRIMGRDIYPFLVSDSAYPLSNWLMKPFSQSAALTNDQKNSTIVFLVHAQ